MSHPNLLFKKEECQFFTRYDVISICKYSFWEQKTNLRQKVKMPQKFTLKIPDWVMTTKQIVLLTLFIPT